MRVEFLHPSLIKEKGRSLSSNDASLVLRLTFGRVSFLFPGDVESAAEGEILKTGDEPPQYGPEGSPPRQQDVEHG